MLLLLSLILLLFSSLCYCVCRFFLLLLFFVGIAVMHVRHHSFPRGGSSFLHRIQLRLVYIFAYTAGIRVKVIVLN